MQWLTGPAGIKREKRPSGNKKSEHLEDMFMKKGEGYGTQFTQQNPHHQERQNK